MPQWLEERRASVSVKTPIADTAVVRLTPTSLVRMSVSRVTDREIVRELVALKREGLAESSVRRYRASLSTFFAWAVRERLVVGNPVTGTRVPRDSRPRVEMCPFGEAELEAFINRVAAHSQHLSEVLLVDAWTGLRWSELRAIRVRDFVELPMPMRVVQVAEPEGVDVKAPKSGRARRVPVADRVLPLVRAMMAGNAGGDRLFVSESGHQLHASALTRTSHWASAADGRRIHDLRHTAACLWLARGVDPVTVQAWMGHASIATTNLYLHHLGTSADLAGLGRLNAAGQTGGTRTGMSGDVRGSKSD